MFSTSPAPAPLALPPATQATGSISCVSGRLWSPWGQCPQHSEGHTALGAGWSRLCVGPSAAPAKLSGGGSACAGVSEEPALGRTRGWRGRGPACLLGAVDAALLVSPCSRREPGGACPCTAQARDRVMGTTASLDPRSWACRESLPASCWAPHWSDATSEKPPLITPLQAPVCLPKAPVHGWSFLSGGRSLSGWEQPSFPPTRRISDEVGSSGLQSSAETSTHPRTQTCRCQWVLPAPPPAGPRGITWGPGPHRSPWPDLTLQAAPA